MKLLLIRHGQSVGNTEGIIQGHTDFPLSEQGRDQAHVLARRLHHEAWPLAAIYASDLSRAAETAQIVAAPFGLTVALDARLREYDFGMLNGLVWRDIEALHPEIWQQFHEAHQWPPIPGEEGQDAFQARLLGALHEITVRHQNDRAAAIVAHAGSLGIVLCHLLGIPARRPAPFRLGNTSLSIVEFGHRQPVLALCNDTSHLGDRP